MGKTKNKRHAIKATPLGDAGAKHADEALETMEDVCTDSVENVIAQLQSSTFAKLVDRFKIWTRIKRKISLTFSQIRQMRRNAV